MDNKLIQIKRIPIVMILNDLHVGKAVLGNYQMF